MATHPFYEYSSLRNGEEPTFNCGSRLSQIGAPANGKVLDGWEIRGGGKCCSYCGSHSEGDFIDILKHYAAGEDGYNFSTTTKRYKYYARRPGVVNAGEGGIKFYTWHISDPVAPENEEIFKKAMAAYRAEMRKLYGGPNES